MISLEPTFSSRDGGQEIPLDYKQLKRTDTVAIYERSRDGKVYDYEVFLIKTDPKGKVSKFPNGVVKVLEDDKEKYPASSLFGRIAWSVSNLGLALHRYNELVNGKVVVEDSIEDTDTTSTPQEVIPSEPSEDAKPYTGATLTIPVGEFSTQELADFNKVAYVNAYLFVKDQERKGKIKFSRKERRNAKGKPTTLFKMNTP